jgi:predicted transcriptional regulator
MSQAIITLQLDTEQQLNLDRIATELACDRADLIKRAIDSYLANYQPSRHAFGALRHTGEIVGDILEPIVLESDWEALR